MSFVWTTITAGVTEAQAAHMNQIKSNVDILATNLGIALYGWVNYPISIDTIIRATPHVSELRSGLDYIHNNNFCSSECTLNYTSVRSAYYASNLGADNPANLGSNFGAELGTYQLGAHGCAP